MTHRNSIIRPYNSLHLHPPARIARGAVRKGRPAIFDHWCAFAVGGAHFNGQILSGGGGEGIDPSHPGEGWVDGRLKLRVGPGIPIIEGHFPLRYATIPGGGESIDILLARID